jgi:hypothetical protein
VVGSDLGVHGLAYLGVLLLFVGVFGLVAFAFGDVTPSLRPVAELSCAAVPFLAARLMLRHGAAVVGRALEVVGGLLLPVMGITSLVDGYPFPPNPRGAALVIGLTLVSVASALVFAVWTVRYEESGVRYAVAPALWLGAAMATIGVGRPMPSGQDVAVPSSHQAAAMTAALVVTLAVARLRPGNRLAQATLAAGTPGAVVIGLLAVLSWAADGVPVLPVAVTGALLLVALELLRARIPGTVADVVGPVWLGGVALALASVAPVGPVAAGAALGFGVLLEAAAGRRAASSTLALPGLGLAAVLIVVWPATWWTVGVVVAVGAWATLRRTRPFPGSEGLLDAAVAVLPGVAALAVGSLTAPGWGLAAATGLVVLSTVPATLPALARSDGDRFWTMWWRGGLVVVGVAAVGAWPDPSVVGRWTVVGSLLALGAVALLGPLGRTLRPWAVTALMGLAWVLGCAVAAVPDAARGTVLAVAAVGMVAAARRDRASLGLVGHTLALAALGLAGDRWGLVATLGLATAGWAVTAVRGDRSASPVATVLDNLHDHLRYAPWALVALGLPVTSLLALDRGDVLALSDPWRVAVPAGAALFYAVSARLLASRRPRSVAALGSFVAALVAVAVAWDLWPAVAALTTVVVAVGVIPADRRWEPMRWAAWAAVAPLAGLLAWQLWPGYGALAVPTAVAITAAAVGGVLLIGATALRARAGTDAVRVIGALELGVAVLVAVAAMALPDAGWIVAAVAAVVLTVAVQTGTGGLGGAAVVMAWGATVALAWDGLGRAPWVSVALAAALLGVAEGLHRLTGARGRWTRWDLPLLAAAAPMALTALASATDGDAFSATYALVGGLTVGVAVRLRRRADLAEVLGGTGTVLILTAADRAETGWLALAFLALAATHTGLAVRASGGARLARQVVGVTAAVTAWGVATTWLPWSTQTTVDTTAVLAGGVLLLAAGAARIRRLDRSWVIVWGTAASAVLTVAVLAAVGEPGLGTAAADSSLWSVLAVACLGVSAGVSAGPLRLPALRDLTAAAMVADVLLALDAAGSTDREAVWVLSLVAVLGAAPALALSRREGSTWTRPIVEAGAAAAAVAVGIGLVGLPDASLLVAAVAATAVQVAAAGVALRSVGLQVAAPTLACAAWLLLVGSADGPPEWYTIAVGSTLLVVVAIWRRDLRLRGQDAAPSTVVVVELVGVAFLVVASLVQAVTSAPGHAVVAMLVGLAIVGWGAVTTVRRRLAAGVVVIVVAVVLLVAVPLVRLLPAWGGAGVWLLLVGLGSVAVVAATVLERGRVVVRSALGRLGELTVGWE